MSILYQIVLLNIELHLRLLEPLGLFDISKSNKSFSTLPTVTSIGGTIGSGAIIVPQSTTIGALKEGVSIDIQDIGLIILLTKL